MVSQALQGKRFFQILQCAQCRISGICVKITENRLRNEADFFLENFAEINFEKFLEFAENIMKTIEKNSPLYVNEKHIRIYISIYISICISIYISICIYKGHPNVYIYV